MNTLGLVNCSDDDRKICWLINKLFQHHREMDLMLLFQQKKALKFISAITVNPCTTVKGLLGHTRKTERKNGLLYSFCYFIPQTVINKHCFR